MASAKPPDLGRAREWLEGRVSPRRRLHSEGVLISARELAAAYGVEPAPLELAAMVHDCARELTEHELLRRAEAWGLPVRDVDRRCPVLLHGRVGLELARRELGQVAPATASAVIYHTAGHPEMSLSDKIFYLSDHIEPGRGFADVERLRQAARDDVDSAVLLAIEINRDYLQDAGKTLDPDTLALEAKLRRT